MRRRAFIQTAFATAGVASIPCRDAFAVFYRPVEQYQQLPDVDAVTGDGQHIRLTGVTLADLRARLRGRLLLAGNPGYDDARRIRNPAFDKRPALIVQPTGVADIRTAVDFARENRGLLLAVKCGGHSFSGLSTCDRGMQIDLSLFRDVRVDPAARRAWVTGGCLLGQVDHETTALGLATPLGTVSDTGVGGLATGGGFGRLARRFGLSVDNVVAVDVVTADGQLRHASNAENPDLLWGVRGGGGNFGIVTNFEFQLHPMPQPIFSGNIAYPIVAPGAVAESEALRAAGFTLRPEPARHGGQGTASVAVYLQNAYLKLISAGAGENAKDSPLLSSPRVRSAWQKSIGTKLPAWASESSRSSASSIER
jgi:hypothetical protein